MQITIVYNQPKVTTAKEHWLARSHSKDITAAADSIDASDFIDASEHGVVEQAQLIESFLREAGHQATLYGASDPLELVTFLTKERPELIFNCCESLQSNAVDEMRVAALFEILRIPFTGSSALTLGAALHKDVAKSLFRANGVPTPAWTLAPPGQSPDVTDLTFPLIVKPRREDASIGIGADSIVHNAELLRERLHFIWDQFHQPAIIEEFIVGREVNVSLLSTSAKEFFVLPINEIVFSGSRDPAPIVTYEAKWIAESPDYKSTPTRCPAELPEEVAQRVRSLAVRAAQAVHLRDYGRIDFRIRHSDQAAFVLEANPNPDISADSGFARATRAAGKSHAEAILQIVDRARERMPSGNSPHSW